MTKASDLFVQCLKAEGVTRIFGVPGEENADMMLSLQDSGIEFVLCRHEQGAAFMATVHGRLTGQVGVCLGTLGPGATNLTTGVGQAMLDNAPLLVITGQGGLGRQHHTSHQMIDVGAMMLPLVKKSTSVMSPETIPQIVHQSIRLAEAEQPGAVHIELPEDVAGCEVSAVPLERRRAEPPLAGTPALDAAWKAVSSARRPVILAGHGVVRAGASDALLAFAEALGVGVLTTMMGKGAIPADHPLCCHTIGLGQTDIPDLIARDADCVICVGYDHVEYPPGAWNDDADRKIIHVGAGMAGTGPDYQPVVEVVGDLAASLSALAQKAEEDAPAFDLERQKSLQGRMEDELAARPAGTDGALTPQVMLAMLRRAMAPEDILISGVGAHKMWVARHYRTLKPNTCLISNGFCSMGMPLPGAIAAALACPDRKVVGLAGDGDFLMNVQEMETAARLGADITLIVWANRSYGLIAWKQEDEHDTHTDLSFTNPDWGALAQAFGWSHRACSGPDLEEKLALALEEAGPSLVVVDIDDDANRALTAHLQELTETLGSGRA